MKSTEDNPGLGWTQYEKLLCVYCVDSDSDASVSQYLQCGSDVGLQLVLHSSKTQQLHLHL